MSKITDPKEKMSAAIGALIFFVPHFMEKKTEFVTFYMRQSFGLFLVLLGLQIIETLFTILWVLFLNFIFTILFLGIFVVYIYQVVMAYKGERVEIPYLYKYTNMLIEKVSFLQPLFAPKK